jgi:WD40 repeat protein
MSEDYSFIRAKKLKSEERNYILSVDSSSDAKLACSCSDNTIHVLSSEQLETELVLTAHADAISSVEFSAQNPSQLYSAGCDNKVLFWDLRTGVAPVHQILLEDEISAMTVGMDDSLLACSIENTLFFYDLRNLGKLGTYGDCHTDDITRIRFDPCHPSVLATAGEDGLVCVYDTSVSAQDEAILSILNTDCAVREFGFFGAGAAGIYCLSSIETGSFWHHPSAQRLGNFPELKNDVGVDYFVGCWENRGASDSDQLYLLAGRFDGSGCVSEITPASVQVKGHIEAGGLATGSIQGHADIIRCMAMDSTGRIIFTGGEDGRLCAWRNGPSFNPPSHNGLSRAQRVGNTRYEPY